VLSTATDKTGGTLRRSVSANDLVTVGGIEMKVSDAVRLGALRETSDGTFTDADAEPEPARAQQAAQQQAAAEEEAGLSWSSPAEAQHVSELAQAAAGLGFNPAGLVAECFKHSDPNNVNRH
jgi:hypothetical protein